MRDQSALAFPKDRKDTRFGPSALRKERHPDKAMNRIAYAEARCGSKREMRLNEDKDIKRAPPYFFIRCSATAWKAGSEVGSRRALLAVGKEAKRTMTMSAVGST